MTASLTPVTSADEEETASRPFVAAGMLFIDDDGCVLLLKPTYKPGWEIPGGYLRAGETPSECAVREVREEIGLDTVAGRLLVVDWAPNPTEGDKTLFVFDGGVVAVDSPTADGAEIGEYGFFPAARLGELLVPRLARRVRAAVTCRSTGHTSYLEHGVPIGGGAPP